jgi:XTP/dITP diphosphohydrolase
MQQRGGLRISLRRKLVVATRNLDKLREIQAKLQSLPIDVASLTDFSFIPDVIEDQPDLIGNAIKKAMTVAEATGKWALADDTGLEVGALGGAPGVYSARYSGPGATYESNCKKLLDEMRGIPEGERQAQFKTVACLRTHDGLYCVEGVLGGSIAFEKKGEKGFGYDPVFLLPDGRTLAELSLDEKNRLSHRGRAVEKIIELLRYLMGRDEG